MLLVVAGLIRRDGKLLITLRGGQSSFSGHWEFPGGKVEFGESPQQALTRELREELGIHVSVGPIYEAATHYEQGKGLVILFYPCTILSGRPNPLAAEDMRWVEPQRLHEYAFPPADAQLVARLQNK